MLNYIKHEIQKTSQLVQQIEHDAVLLEKIKEAARCCILALTKHKKIFFAGNGGSAADSQHLAAELVGRLAFDRPGLPAIALTTDGSVLTAVGNDYSFENLFSRQIEALGQAGDVFIGISTSGKSANILKAFEAARNKELTTIGFTGKFSSLMSDHCDVTLDIPSTETQKVQECHIMIGHIICGLIEEEMFGEKLETSLKEKNSATI